MRPSISAHQRNSVISSSGLLVYSFSATSAATTEQALEPAPNPPAYFFQHHGDLRIIMNDLTEPFTALIHNIVLLDSPAVSRKTPAVSE